MSAFIRSIEGKIASVNHGKKEISLAIQEIIAGVQQEKKLDFLLDSNARITNAFNQQMKLVGLKVEDKVEVRYTRDKSQRTAVYIKVIS